MDLLWPERGGKWRGAARHLLLKLAEAKACRVEAGSLEDSEATGAWGRKKAWPI